MRYAHSGGMAKSINVQDVRNRLKWSRARLAEEAGVDVSTVGRWETEGVPERGPAKAFLERLAKDAARREDHAPQEADA